MVKSDQTEEIGRTGPTGTSGSSNSPASSANDSPTARTWASSPSTSDALVAPKADDPIDDSQVPPICAVLDRQNNAAGARRNDQPTDEPGAYRVYKWRWYVLSVVALLNCLNALSWIAYAPISDKTDIFYGANTAFYLTLVFLIAAIPVGIFGMWTVGRFGIRSAILAAAWMNFIGSAIRLLSSVEVAIPSPIARRYVVISGQVVAACAYPFIMYLPTKIAAAWFPGTQRATANTVATLSNPLGVLLAMVISPNFVRQAHEMLYLNLLICICCAVSTAMATLGVRSSEPPTPPSKGAAEESLPFVQGLKKLITSKSYIILFFALGAGIGMFNAMYGMMQPILCARGYSNSFSGLCCVLMIVGGFIGAFLSGRFVDRTKKFEETMKVAFGFAVLGGVAFSLSALRSNFSVPIAVSCVVFGFFGLAAYPIGLEMSVECSFPVAEATASGMIVLSGQIQGSLFMIMMQLLRTPLTGPDLNVETCTPNERRYVETFKDETVRPYDMTVPLMAFCAIAASVISFFVLVFYPELKRLKLEKGNGKRASRDHRPKSEEQEMIDLRNKRASAPNSPLATSVKNV